MKIGNLIRFKQTGVMGIVTREVFTKRFITYKDHDLIDAGMGHLAGEYGSAIEVKITHNGNQTYDRIGQKMTVKLTYPSTFEVLA